MTTAALLQTPLHDWHVARGARMVDFGGWSMPVQYGSIVAEHQACRQGAALFDVSHMGRFHFTGGDTAKFLDRLCTRQIVGMPLGAIRYSLLTNAGGGILDDILVYHLELPGQPPYFWLVVNAGNREKIAAWIAAHLDSAEDVAFADRTLDTAMIAVQGPQALAVAQSLTAMPLAAMKYYTGVHAVFAGTAAMVSRTGYTGEDGCEITVPAEAATRIWDALLAAGAEAGAQPAGLGARDTLRLEAAMPLYGHELNEQIGPVQAGLSFAVQLRDRQFIGCDAISRQASDAALPKRIGLALAGKRVPREHYAVLDEDRSVGEVTSGTYSPTLNQPIAMAYVAPSCAEVGRELAIDIRGRREPATIVALPFYKRRP